MFYGAGTLDAPIRGMDTHEQSLEDAQCM